MYRFTDSNIGCFTSLYKGDLIRQGITPYLLLKNRSVINREKSIGDDSVADPGGAAGAPSKGPDFFHIDIQTFRNVRGRHPLREILDLSLRLSGFTKEEKLN